jgi:hypothetical protein
LTPGAVITDKGFISASTSPNVGGIADQLKWNAADGNAWMVIDAPAGTPVAWLGGDHRGMVDGERLTGGAPYEALLMPGTSLEITGQLPANSNGETVVTAKVLP